MDTSTNCRSDPHPSPPPPNNPNLPAAHELRLLPPSAHLPAARGAHDQLRVSRHVDSPGPQWHPPHGNYQEADCHTPFSLRATPPEFRERGVRTNHNPNSVYLFCSATPPITERPAGQTPCETLPEKTPGREGGFWPVRKSRGRKSAVGKLAKPGCLGDNG